MYSQHSIVTFNRAMEILSFDKKKLLEAAQAVDAKLLVPFPSNAAFAIRSGSNGFGRRQLGGTAVQLRQSFDYFVPSSALLAELINFPEVAYDCVTHVANRIQGQATVALSEISEAVDVGFMPRQLNEHTRHLYRLIGFCIRLTEGTTAAFDVEDACLLMEDVTKIQERHEPCYPPGIEDYGEFRPSNYTTRIVRDLNTAYHLFRVKFPVDTSDHDSGRLVESWFDETWNGPPGHRKNRDVGLETVQGAVRTVLETGEVGIGKITLRQAVKERHANGAPKRLMLLEQLLEDYAAWQLGLPAAPGLNLDFRQKSLLAESLDKVGIKDDRYLRLIKKVIPN